MYEQQKHQHDPVAYQGFSLGGGGGATPYNFAIFAKNCMKMKII